MWDLAWDAPVTDPDTGVTDYIIGWAWPDGMGGSTNYHEPFYENPSANMGFKDGHVTHVTELKERGRISSDHRLVPDS